MIGLLKKVILGIASLLEKIRCSMTCCSNQVMVRLPEVYIRRERNE